MPRVSYDTAFEVALSTRFILYHVPERACIAAEALRDHLNSGCVGVLRCIVFHCCATKGSPWIYCYIKHYFTVGSHIFAVSIC
jgi:hypothetical protein